MDEVSIFPEENSITISDHYMVVHVDLDKEEREYEMRMHLKDDTYWRNEIYKYKINHLPIEVKVRLIERSHEPPLSYDVRDGVVLESEINKESFAFGIEERIKTLKKEVEWQDVGIGPISLFILNQHPEIIPKEEFRRYLTQHQEKIKNGIFKVQKYLEKNEPIFKILEGKFGREIASEDDLKNMPEKEANKLVTRRDAIYQKLFDENSSEYVGITEDEFRSSQSRLKLLDLFLNQKPQYQQKKMMSYTKKGGGRRWLIVIALAIIALAWGIWTSIGVFILGAIIINLLTPKVA